MFDCLLDELILGFCYSDLTLETGGFELASAINLVLQANRLTKYASYHKFDACQNFHFIHFTTKPAFPVYCLYTLVYFQSQVFQIDNGKTTLTW